MKELWSRLLTRRLAPAAPVRNEAAEAFEVNAVELSRFALRSLLPVVGLSPFPLNEQLLMAGTLVRFRPSHVFDWGTNIGSSARVFWETARAYGVRCDIHTIDLPDDVSHVEHPGHGRGRLVRDRPGVTLHQGDGLDTALALCERLRPSRALFFVDGDHSYESVRRELRGIVERVERPVILAHDTFWQEPSSGYNVGPAKAVAELRGRFRVVETSLGLPGMTLLY